MSALAVDDLSLRIGTADILRGISLRCPPARITAVLGPPASGKTALLRAVAGLERPQRGTIRIGERTVFDAAKRIDVPPQKRSVGLMPDILGPLPGWTVLQTVATGSRFRGRYWTTTRQRAAAALTKVGLVELAQRPVAQLTYLDQRRVALARALAHEPAVLLIDEPFAGLDEAARTDERLWLQQVVTQIGMTTVLATADRADALALAERIALLNAGSVEQEGTPSELHEQPTTAFAAAYMGTSNRIEGTLVEQSGGRAFMDVMGVRIGGMSRTKAEAGAKATGVIRVDRVRPGGGPGANRIPMKLKAQVYLGERWELVFAREALTVRAYASAPLRHEDYHVELPAEALWIF